MAFSYLASPYTSSDPAVMQERYLQAERTTARLLAAGLFVYSPIVHCHNLAAAHNLPKDAGFWRQYNQAMLSCASKLLILPLDGWEESVGVANEITFAVACEIPIFMVGEENTPCQAFQLN